MRVLLWLTADLRLDDNPALNAALDASGPTGQVVPVYILDDSNPWPLQGAALWWLHHSLEALQTSLKPSGGRLSLFRGDPARLLPQLMKQHEFDAVFFSQGFEPYEDRLQKTLHQWCQKHDRECRRFAGRLLFNPDTNLNQQGKPFQVFTPYYKSSVRNFSIAPCQPAPATTDLKKHLRKKSLPNSLALADLKLLPTRPNWAAGFDQYWQPGEAGAHARLKDAISDRLHHYAEERDLPAKDSTSGLSPHLRFGEISPRRVWHEVIAQLDAETREPFLRQLVWRDFSYNLLVHWPDFPDKSFKQDFAHFPWQKNARHLRAWQRGQTGYPVVDAGMRQLWHTGWMHNRVRMIVASFLTKHLRIHWLAGAHWFWDTLVDADLGNNSAGWQWVAGSGADAAPYFRIFNPTLQGEKFDPNGDYVRQWVPELRGMDSKHIHTPWKAPEAALADAGVTLGQDYPKPIVDHSEARQAALTAYQSLRDRT